jgi:hypothetical protein
MIADDEQQCGRVRSNALYTTPSRRNLERVMERLERDGDLR